MLLPWFRRPRRRRHSFEYIYKQLHLIVVIIIIITYFEQTKITARDWRIYKKKRYRISES